MFNIGKTDEIRSADIKEAAIPTLVNVIWPWVSWSSQIALS